MDDNRRAQLLEQYQDIAFSLLMDDFANDEGQQLLREFEDAQKNGKLDEIPPELDKKCRELINKSFAKQDRTMWLKRAAAFLSKAAVIALVLLGLTTVTVLSVDAFRIPVLNLLMDQSGKYSTLMFSSSSSTEPAASSRVVSQFEAYLPEGYRIIQNTFDDTSGLIYCSDENNNIIYLEVEKSERGINIDTEDISYTDLDFADYTAVFGEKDGNHLRWLDSQNDTVYTLYSNGIDINTFWKFAYTIIE